MSVCVCACVRVCVCVCVCISTQTHSLSIRNKHSNNGYVIFNIIPFFNALFKPVKLRLKIDLVSYPARAEGLVHIYIYIYIYIYI